MAKFLEYLVLVLSGVSIALLFTRALTDVYEISKNQIQ